MYEDQPSAESCIRCGPPSIVESLHVTPWGAVCGGCNTELHNLAFGMGIGQ
jgi:hypothetical protein